MSRLVQVGKKSYDRDQFSTWINYAFDAYEELGGQDWATLDPKVRLASFVKALPEKSTEAIKPTQLLLDLGMAFDPTTLDAPPKLECVWGTIPTAEVELHAVLAELHDKATGTDTEAKNAKRELAAVAQFLEHFGAIRETYWSRCHSIWAAMQMAEWVATDYYYAFLAHNRYLASKERDRYLYPKSAGPYLPRATSQDFEGMRRGLSLVNKARQAAAIDQIRREQFVVQATSLGLCALVICQQLSEGRLFPESQDLRRLREATGLASQAAQNMADAMTQYLDVVRGQATSYPILTLLGPREVRADGLSNLAQKIDEVVTEAQVAIDHLMTEGARRFVIPQTFQQPTPQALAKSVADSSVVSVWKVPFFLERAIQTLPLAQAEDVDHVRVLASQLESGTAIKSAIALGGIDVAIMAAPAAGPIGVAIAMQWACIQLFRSIEEYQQLSNLFKASIDPNYLLLGLDHEPASRIGMILAFIGVIFP